jgi:hypothetical protein
MTQNIWKPSSHQALLNIQQDRPSTLPSSSVQHMQESISRTKSVKANARPSGQVVFTDLIILDLESVMRNQKLISTPLSLIFTQAFL